MGGEGSGHLTHGPDLTPGARDPVEDAEQIRMLQSPVAVAELGV